MKSDNQIKQSKNNLVYNKRSEFCIESRRLTQQMKTRQTNDVRAPY